MSKVQSHHLQKPAYIYVRQSTMGQVRDHQESTERNRAVGSSTRTSGSRGAQTTNREDFKTLVADVSLGRVGAIFALEASRLARSNLEWHWLIEICALTRLRPGGLQVHRPDHRPGCGVDRARRSWASPLPGSPQGGPS